MNKTNLVVKVVGGLPPMHVPGADVPCPNLEIIAQDMGDAAHILGQILSSTAAQALKQTQPSLHQRATDVCDRLGVL